LETEDRVWAEVTALLTDPERLHDLADEYLGLAGDAVSRVNGVESLDRQDRPATAADGPGTASYIPAGADPKTLA